MMKVIRRERQDMVESMGLDRKKIVMNLIKTEIIKTQILSKSDLIIFQKSVFRSYFDHQPKVG